MNQIFKFWSLSLLFFAATVPETYAFVRSSCYQTSAQGHWWDYCITEESTSTNPDVVYYFHGIYGSEYEWQNAATVKKIYQLWGSNAPKVVSVSYGSVWLLAEKNNSRYSGLYEHFIKVALPDIEQKRNLKPARRMLAGSSMGGFNAAQVYLKNPELFAKVSLACPAITTVSPYASDEEVEAYIERTNADENSVWNAITLSQYYFPSQKAWRVSDPMALSQTRVTTTSPALFVSVGLQDEYGFFEGSKIFADQAKAQGAQVTWIGLPGYHCTMDWEGTAKFLLAK